MITDPGRDVCDVLSPSFTVPLPVMQELVMCVDSAFTLFGEASTLLRGQMGTCQLSSAEV